MNRTADSGVQAQKMHSKDMFEKIGKMKIKNTLHATAFLSGGAGCILVDVSVRSPGSGSESPFSPCQAHGSQRQTDQLWVYCCFTEK